MLREGIVSDSKAIEQAPKIRRGSTSRPQGACGVYPVAQRGLEFSNQRAKPNWFTSGGTLLESLQWGYSPP